MTFSSVNANVLKKSAYTFLRSSDTTPYNTFVNVGNGSPISIPAPVRDRPFYIRKLELQIVPGNSVAVTYALWLYSGVPETVADGASMNQTTNAQNRIVEGRLQFNVGAGTQIGIGQPPVGASFLLQAPTGLVYGLLETTTAYTPTAGQRFEFNMYTEHSN